MPLVPPRAWARVTLQFLPPTTQCAPFIPRARVYNRYSTRISVPADSQQIVSPAWISTLRPRHIITCLRALLAACKSCPSRSPVDPDRPADPVVASLCFDPVRMTFFYLPAASFVTPIARPWTSCHPSSARLTRAALTSRRARRLQTAAHCSVRRCRARLSQSNLRRRSTR